MFQDCKLLTSLDLSNFDTSNANSIRYMFNGCESLTSIDLSNFDTRSLTMIEGLFQNCKNLKYVNISTFENNGIKDMGFMFKGCSSLTSIDIYNFITNEVMNMSNIFAGCSNLIYINLTNAKINESAIISNIIDNSLKNPIVCIDKKYFNKIVSSYDCPLTCSDWGEYTEKINNDSNSCAKGCLFSLYENGCHKICSYNFYYNETINQYMCTDKRSINMNLIINAIKSVQPSEIIIVFQIVQEKRHIYGQII